MAEKPWVPAAIRWLLLILLVGTLEVLARAHVTSPLVIPAPSRILEALIGILASHRFLDDLSRTAVEVSASSTAGVLVGLVIGALGWRFALIADSLEPYLVALYAMPTLVFYPILLALMGLGPGPIVVITTFMVVVPVALNTTTGLRSIPPVLIKMGRSINCSRLTLMRKVLIPAAIPLLMPGLKLGLIYGMVGAIAMEFILANKGLGYEIGYLYNGYHIAEMWAYILVVMALGMCLVAGLDLLERRIRTDMT
jgi:NitT/TauT family transport system permease protein